MRTCQQRLADEPDQPKMGWQQNATRQTENKFIHEEVWPGLDDCVQIPARAFGFDASHRNAHVKGDEDGEHPSM